MSLDDLEKLVDIGHRSHADHRPKVVVVDDDAGIRTSLLAVLKGDYDVSACKNAVEAVRHIDDSTDCVILDVKMPLHDGFWVAEQLRNGHQDVPIIFHSAYQDVKDPYEVINEFRPFGYLVKGASLSGLLDVVAKACMFSQRVRRLQQTRALLRQARDDVRGLSDAVPPARPGGSGDR